MPSVDVGPVTWVAGRRLSDVLHLDLVPEADKRTDVSVSIDSDVVSRMTGSHVGNVCFRSGFALLTADCAPRNKDVNRERI